MMVSFGYLWLEYPEYMFTIVFIIIILIADAKYVAWKAHRRGEKTESDYAQEQAERRRKAEIQVQQDQVFKKAAARSAEFFQREAAENQMSNYDWSVYVSELSRNPERPPEHDRYIIQEDPTRKENLNAYASPLAIMQSSGYFLWMVARCDHLLSQHVTAVSFEDRRPAEQTELFWKLRRVESFYVPRLKRFFRTYKKNPTYRKAFEGFWTFRNRASDQIHYDRNKKSDLYSPHSCVGFLLDYTTNPQNQLKLYLFNWMIEHLARYKGISYLESFHELSDVLSTIDVD